MPLVFWTCCQRIKATRVAVAAFVGVAAAVAGAQTSSPKAEIFGGYSYMYPHAVINGTVPGAVLPLSSCLCAIPRGAGGSVTFDFNRWLGLTADLSGHWGGNASTLPDEVSRSSFYNASLGPKLTYRSNHFSPFAEALVGAHRLSPQLFSPDTRFGFIAGGGLDWNLGHHFALRVVQADFVFSNHHFGSVASVADTSIRGVRLQTGVVFAFGGHRSLQAALAPVEAPSQQTTFIAPPVVVAPVIEGPSVMCSANPSIMASGDSATITAVGTSTRPLSYSYSATGGAISGSTSTAILSTAGIAAGNILVTCNVMDDMGKTALATAAITITAGRPAAVIAARTLCSASFERDMRRPTRVDNEAKACLDDVALSLQRDFQATLVLNGSAAPTEHGRKDVATQRAIHTKAYLVDDKGIDSSRVAIYTSSQNGKSVSIVLLPMGATAPANDNEPIDERVTAAKSRSSASRARSH